MKITSAFKDTNNTDSIDTIWKRKRELLVQEINKDCTFQPSPLKLNKNKLNKTTNDVSPNPNTKNVHDRLYDNFKNNIFNYTPTSKINYSKLFKDSNPMINNTLISYETLNTDKYYNGKKIKDNITQQNYRKNEEYKVEVSNMFDGILSDIITGIDIFKNNNFNNTEKLNSILKKVENNNINSERVKEDDGSNADEG